jgi:pimeloyl-ACP methyl ester carboxylesterase
MQFRHINLQTPLPASYFHFFKTKFMKHYVLSTIALLISGFLSAQPDFEKMKAEFVSRKAALDTMVAYPDVPFDSLKAINAEGTTISFWWMPHEKVKGTALLVHGFNMNKSMMLARATIYYKLGLNVIVMDLRARGQSGGKSTTSGPEISSDVIAVMDYYNSNLNDYGSLILIGFSHGGRAVVFAAEKKPDHVKAIILESIPYSLAESFKRMYHFDPPPIPEGDIDKAFISISSLPVLLMTGNNDEAIIPEEANKIKETFRNKNSRLVSFKDAGHDLSVEQFRPEYKKCIEEFVRITIL